eukprot:CAMPEP_0197029698 /NCGR_PEP_ID=MMETSP1384-20130603/9093_1 /TAXON_ID=29189 /ORGANISM="Ammonia sp." /LENGTH=202 /DNA_ID=CAMNT_0042458911 /DNA_START=68 /DNA_END=672 /DNA_ORIENTATION=+
MDYSQHRHRQHAPSYHNENKPPNSKMGKVLQENQALQNSASKPKMKHIAMEEYEGLLREVERLKKDTAGFNKLKSQLLQVSKKETEEYANNIAGYSSVFDSMKSEIEQLTRTVNEYREKDRNQTEQIRTMAKAVESTRAQCQQKDEQIQKLQQQNMSFQHEKEMLKQQIRSIRENFFNDEHLVSNLCAKLEIDGAHNFNGLV